MKSIYVLSLLALFSSLQAFAYCPEGNATAEGTVMTFIDTLLREPYRGTNLPHCQYTYPQALMTGEASAKYGSSEGRYLLEQALIARFYTYDLVKPWEVSEDEFSLVEQAVDSADEKAGYAVRNFDVMALVHVNPRYVHLAGPDKTPALYLNVTVECPKRRLPSFLSPGCKISKIDDREHIVAKHAPGFSL